MDSIASLLGLALRAGRLAVGEEPVRTASRSHKAYLLLLASDAADNTIRRAHHFTQTGTNTICLTIPVTKEALGAPLGRASCAMLAVTDVGFAAALAKKLAEIDEEAFGFARDALTPKAERANKRRKLSKKRTRRTEEGQPGSGKKDTRNADRESRS